MSARFTDRREKPFNMIENEADVMGWICDEDEEIPANLGEIRSR